MMSMIRIRTVPAWAVPGRAFVLPVLAMCVFGVAGCSSSSNNTASVDPSKADSYVAQQFSQADRGAHTSGDGLMFGIFDRQGLARKPVTISVPATFGEHAFTGWTVDGRPAPAAAVEGNRLTVDRSCDVQALYNRQVLG